MDERFKIGCIVTSKAGHDAGCAYVVVGCDKDYVYLSDGRNKTIEKPKKKKMKHLQFTKQIADEVIEKIESKKPVMNEDVKRSLKIYNSRNV